MIRRAAVALLVVAGCSGHPPRPSGDDAVHAAPRGDASVTPAPAPVDAAGATAATGELAVRVEWAGVPVVARRSPGRTPCHTPRAPQVAPTTTWGVPEAVVLAEGLAAPGAARVVLADCALAPRVAVGATLTVASEVDRPARVTLARWGDVDHLDALAAQPTRAIQLPIAGHAVTVALEPGGVYQLATSDPSPEVAWVIAGPAAITDATGQVVLELPAGKHRATAWVPPRAGQPARTAAADATVPGGGRASLTLAIKAPAP